MYIFIFNMKKVIGKDLHMHLLLTIVKLLL